MCEYCSSIEDKNKGECELEICTVKGNDISFCIDGKKLTVWVDENIVGTTQIKYCPRCGRELT